MDEQCGVATIIDDEIGAAANSQVKALRAVRVSVRTTIRDLPANLGPESGFLCPEISSENSSPNRIGRADTRSQFGRLRSSEKGDERSRP
ncbi:hypothetical protein MRB53_001615 [Persea americana]|uniref:Uncharacterized protein n=1 Tax=Persea americana TaxID=3435 RepID=A0ACC2MS64_PERAE|nr:hypothetical protein MRB53_001615 [Persea americana]